MLLRCDLTGGRRPRERPRRSERGAYRPEIDGLRAVAVIPVVLYHAHMPGVSGGFVGVDVFFVISGFLITGILAGDVAAGRFSILTFYERRVRRIFPALFAMLAVSCLLALRLLLPHELEDFARSLTAAALFVSNLHFMGETGYFVGAPGTKPLLHTWSLSVEEQFYIVFPVYLYLMSRWAPRWLLPVTVTMLALSLIWCVLMTHPQDDEAFYFTPTRVWELLAGSVLALAPRRRPLPGGVAQLLGARGPRADRGGRLRLRRPDAVPGDRGGGPGGGDGAGPLRHGGEPDPRRSAAVARAAALLRADLLLALSLALAAAGVLRLLAGRAAGALGDRGWWFWSRSRSQRCPGATSSVRSAPARCLRADRAFSQAASRRWPARCCSGRSSPGSAVCRAACRPSCWRWRRSGATSRASPPATRCRAGGPA